MWPAAKAAPSLRHASSRSSPTACVGRTSTSPARPIKPARTRAAPAARCRCWSITSSTRSNRPAMSRVDFYVLSADAPDARLRYACRLAERAVEQGCQVYIQTPDVQRLDDMLWTFSDGSFLPHEVYQGQAP